MEIIKLKLQSILEGTFIEEAALSKEEVDEIYKLKDEVKSKETKLLFIKDPNEKKHCQKEIEKMTERIHQLRSKALAQ